MADIITAGGHTGYIQVAGKQVSGDGVTTFDVRLDRDQGEPFLAAMLADRFKKYDHLGGYVIADRCSVRSGHFDTVTLAFSSKMDFGGGGSSQIGDRVKTTYTVASAMYEKALADHPNYRMFWDNGLWQWVPKDAEPPNSSPARPRRKLPARCISGVPLFPRPRAARVRGSASFRRTSPV